MNKELAGVLNDRHRHVIWAVVEEIAAQAPKDSVALQLLPPVDVPAAVIEHEIVSGSGGKTNERQLGAPGKNISGGSSTSKIFEPGSYQEAIPFREKELLKLRKLGTLGDRGATGLTGGELDWMNRAANKLKKRLINRMAQLAWDALFTGHYVYQGVTFDFGIPGANALTAATDWSVASTGKPFEDLVALVGQNQYLRKYANLIKTFVINPKTEADIVQRALESKYLQGNANVVSGGINEVRKFVAPGLPPFTVCADVVQDESEDADGNITLGTATFLVPDDKVLVVFDLGASGAMFPEYGQMQITENMNDPSATIQKPAVGIYTFIDEKGMQERKSPHIDIVAGFNGAPNLMRSNDVFVISV